MLFTFLINFQLKPSLEIVSNNSFTSFNKNDVYYLRLNKKLRCFLYIWQQRTSEIPPGLNMRPDDDADRFDENFRATSFCVAHFHFKIHRFNNTHSTFILLRQSTVKKLHYHLVDYSLNHYWLLHLVIVICWDVNLYSGQHINLMCQNFTMKL